MFTIYYSVHIHYLIQIQIHINYLIQIQTHIHYLIQIIQINEIAAVDFLAQLTNNSIRYRACFTGKPVKKRLQEL
jgi:hypothetical protein